MEAPKAAHVTANQPQAAVQMNAMNPATPANSQQHQQHEHKAHRIRGGGVGKDCFIGLFGCFVCFECCEGCCECAADILCCPCEMCC